MAKEQMSILFVEAKKDESAVYTYALVDRDHAVVEQKDYKTGEVKAIHDSIIESINKKGMASTENWSAFEVYQ